jgi:tetrapyrrole methylase family protein / MazG family protein
MEQFDELLKISEILLGPEGCPWDREQTMFSLQPYFIEEAHELLEAIDKDEDGHIVEEAGDLLYAIVFLAKVAENEGRFTMNDIIKGEGEKLIRRHPHVFAGKKIKGIEDIKITWEEVKKQEGKKRKTPFEGIPPTLPILPKAQKVVGRIFKEEKGEKYSSEEELKDDLLKILKKAQSSELSLEGALRRLLLDLEKSHGG